VPQATGEPFQSSAARQEEIRRRAYEIYLERGEQPGSELDDWLRAENESNMELELPVKIENLITASFITAQDPRTSLAACGDTELFYADERTEEV